MKNTHVYCIFIWSTRKSTSVFGEMGNEKKRAFEVIYFLYVFVKKSNFVFFFLFFNVILWFIEKISSLYRGYQAAKYISFEIIIFNLYCGVTLYSAIPRTPTQRTCTARFLTLLAKAKLFQHFWTKVLIFKFVSCLQL